MAEFELRDHGIPFPADPLRKSQVVAREVVPRRPVIARGRLAGKKRLTQSVQRLPIERFPRDGFPFQGVRRVNFNAFASRCERMPYMAARARTRWAEAESLDSFGAGERRTAAIIRFLAVCSVEVNSKTDVS